VWLGRLLDMQNRADVWNGLIEREPAIVSDLWGMIFGRALSQHDSMLILRGSLPHSFLSRVSLTGWETLSDKELLEQLPDPGPDWTLVIEHSERRATTGHSQSSRRTTKKPSRSIWSETLGTPSESQKGSSGGAKARRPRKAPASPAKATTPRVSPARTRSKPKPPPRKPRGK
jgi:hypothetical protein